MFSTSVCFWMETSIHMTPVWVILVQKRFCGFMFRVLGQWAKDSASNVFTIGKNCNVIVAILPVSDYFWNDCVFLKSHSIYYYKKVQCVYCTLYIHFPACFILHEFATSLPVLSNYQNVCIFMCHSFSSFFAHPFFPLEIDFSIILWEKYIILVLSSAWQ